MHIRNLASFTTALIFTGSFSLSVHAQSSVAVGDSSGYVAAVLVRDQDLKNVCSVEKFQEAFRFAYMSMWNGRIDKILEAKPNAAIVTYYEEKYFFTAPDKRATATSYQRNREGDTTYCQEASHQQGTTNGFLYALEGLKVLEDHAPK